MVEDLGQRVRRKGARRGRAGGGGGGEVARVEEARTDDESPGDLLCATCRTRITHEVHRIEVAGGHEHTFVNPGGFVHRVGCFGLAVNLSYLGEPETAFAWFPGFSWQIAACGRCATHLGWIFRCADDQFHGLLLVKLVLRSH
jgi:hypothetical protein